MSPYQAIFEAYRKHRPDINFSDEMSFYLTHGFVFSTPSYFAMGKPINRLLSEQVGFATLRAPEGSKPDCWYICAASGKIGRIWSILPYPLPWVAWTRVHDPENELQFHSLEALRRHCPADFDLCDESRLQPIPA